MAKRKLVLEEHDGCTLVGVLQDGCDPVIKTTEGGLDEALAAIPGFLTEAQEKWAVQPKNPAYTPPAAPKPAPKPAATATPVAPKGEVDWIEKAFIKAGIEQTPSQAPEPDAVASDQTVGGIIRKEAAIEPPDKDIDAGEFAEVPSQIAPQPETQEDMAAEVGTEVTETPDAPAAVEPAPSAPAKPGEWEYYLQDGRGPYETIQMAMDELGLDKDNRPAHNRWDRLSTALKEKIQRRPKA